MHKLKDIFLKNQSYKIQLQLIERKKKKNINFNRHYIAHKKKRKEKEYNLPASTKYLTKTLPYFLC